MQNCAVFLDHLVDSSLVQLASNIAHVLGVNTQNLYFLYFWYGRLLDPHI